MQAHTAFLSIHPMAAHIEDSSWLRAREHLQWQERIFDLCTIGHLETIDVGAGWRCAEVGAGAGSVALWLAQRVAPTGQVFALDVDVQFVAPLSSPTVVVQRHDITQQPLMPNAFDLIHARILMPHVYSRNAVLTHMTTGLKPGGWVLIEVCETVIGAAKHPATDLHIKAAEALRLIFNRDSEDLYFGRKLRSAFKALGLVDICTDVCPAISSSYVNLFALTLQQQRITLVAAGLMRDDEIDAAIAEVPRTPASDDYFATMVAVWGRRPGQQSTDG